jgi:enterochelin esterase-like enzyme
MKRAGLAVLAGTLAAAGAVALAAPADREQDLAFHSHALDGTLHYEVYLPSGYATSGKRYPVVYFLHGLPSSGTAYQAAGFVESALDATGDEAILVAPQGARWNEPDPEYVDHGPGDRWETAIATDLVHTVDSRFRTIAARDGRALIGLSAGGFGAMHIALAHLSEFSVVESWSGYFHPTDPTGTKALQLGAKNDVHRQLLATKATLRRLHTFVSFYVGGGDSRFVAENRELNAELTRAGIPHVFRLYAGGHDQRLWQSHASAWLSLAVAHLSAAAS